MPVHQSVSLPPSGHNEGQESDLAMLHLSTKEATYDGRELVELKMHVFLLQGTLSNFEHVGSHGLQPSETLPRPFQSASWLHA